MQTQKWKVGLALGLLLLLVGLVKLAPTAAAPQAATMNSLPSSAYAQRAGANAPLVAHDLKHDVSPALRTIAPIAPVANAQIGDRDTLPDPIHWSGKRVQDTVVQAFARLGTLAMPAPIANFDGQYNQYGVIPPDTNGDVGPNHYFQIVNTGFQIFNKSGTSLYGPASNKTLWTGFGGPCEMRNDGDPVVLYDPLADRWMVTQFTSAAPYEQCFAVSTGPDPTGSYNRYAFLMSNTALFDYPKFGVWPEAYYGTFNAFTGNSYTGAYFVAFDRVAMLAGLGATAIFEGPFANDYSVLPADMDGHTPPSANEPNPMAEAYDGASGTIRFFDFHADFTTPSNTTLVGPISVAVAPWNEVCPNAPRQRCVPQPGTTAMLEVLGGRLMFRLAYRHFGDHESLVANQSVDPGTGVSAIRWYEFRNPTSGTPTVFQQGTFAPNDGLWRWMGSIAQDASGDLAVGYSVSSASTYPGITYTGRLASDPPNTLPRGEALLHAGGGSEDYPAAPRWGDYSALTVDPADDCTFWYTQEYFSETGLRNWRTRVGSFRFPSCTSSPPATTTPPLETATPTPQASPTACAGSESFTGSITNTDQILMGRIPVGIPSTCDVPKTCPGTGDGLPRHYKRYTFTNTNATAECVTVDIAQACGDNAILSAAYDGTFDPTNLCAANYLADGGNIGPHGQYSFDLPAGHTAVIVMYENSPNLGCASYTLSVNSCSVPTATMTAVATSTSTATATRTAGPTETMTVVASATATTGIVGSTPTETTTPLASATPCTISFTDVIPADYFYTPVQYLACHGVISGYADHTFRPYNNTTRGQMVKIVVLGFHLQIPPAPIMQTFEDVPPSNPFFVYIETAAARGIVSGYTCGHPPAGRCVPPDNRPYFLPNTYVTRGQLSKIVVIAAGFPLITPSTPTFEDVLPGSPFYSFIETLAARGAISGYTCGHAPAGPCLPPGNRPYFLPGNNATRGQIAKIVYNAILALPAPSPTP